MTIYNIFTENIFTNWNVNEKDVIEKTRRLLEFYISNLGKNSCLAGYDYDSITLDIVVSD